MKTTELRKKNREELQGELLALKRAQFGLRVQITTQQLTKTSEIKKIRRDIARVKTLLNEAKT